MLAAAIAAIAAVAAAAAAPPAPSAGAAAREPRPVAPALAAAPMPVRLAVGQMLMVRMEGTAPSHELLRRARHGRIGGVILFGDNVSSGLPATVARLQRAARRGGNPPLLIATDQEGGEVRRLPVPPVPSAEELGTESLHAIHHTGRETARGLLGYGVDVDLAPVVDIPTSPDVFIAQQHRAFGTTPLDVTHRAGAFARGLRAGGVAATLKHFPGLGSVAVSTDQQPATVTASRATLEHRELVPYRRLIAAGDADLVMVGSAVYPALDPSGRPAMLSHRIIHGVLRRELGYRGVAITDSLEAGALSAYPHAPRQALRAGADVLLLDGSEAGSGDVYRSLHADARAHPQDARRARRAAARIVALKARLESAT